MGISFWQIAIVVALVVLLFGRGKISSLMGDVAKGIKSFKKGMKDPIQDHPDTTSSQDHPDTTSSQDHPDTTSSQDQSSEEQNSDKK